MARRHLHFRRHRWLHRMAFETSLCALSHYIAPEVADNLPISLLHSKSRSLFGGRDIPMPRLPSFFWLALNHGSFAYRGVCADWCREPLKHAHFDEITVGRINIVEPDGTKRL